MRVSETTTVCGINGNSGGNANANADSTGNCISNGNGSGKSNNIEIDNMVNKNVVIISRLL